ncbi:hypothetical protein RZE82_02125 [Mollicutes bacterium LVI A0039]|nr:hypothetical protein RZE82_02125 [Mollicutes bacterium LVI A0039]
MGFKKVDLHIHSSSDYSRKNEYDEKEFIDRLKEIESNKLLDVISITDHNIIDVDLYEKVKEELSSTIVFPGFEINLELKDELKDDFGIALKSGRDYFHSIVIIHPDDVQKSQSYLFELFGIKNEDESFWEYSQKISVKKVGINDFFLKFNDIRYYFIPHENKSVEKRNLKYQFYYPRDNEDIRRNNNKFIYSLYFMGSVGLDGKVKLKTDMFNNKGLSDVLFETYEERIAYFTFSDNKTLDEISNKYTWINFNGEFEDLILAFSSVESRIKSSEESHENPQKNIDNYIEKLTYGNDEKIILSPGLNCIVGSRGSGKSSLMRALDQQRIGNLENLEVYKHGTRISNLNQHLLYIEQESLKKIYDDANNIDLKELPLISEIKKKYLDTAEVKHKEKIEEIRKSFKCINKSMSLFLNSYSKKKYYYINNFEANDDNIKSIEPAQNLSSIKGLEKKFNDKIEELKSLFEIDVNENYDEEKEIAQLMMKYNKMLNDFSVSMNESLVEDELDVKVDDSFKRFDYVNRLSAAITKINHKYNSEVTTKLEEYEAEKEYLNKLFNLRKLINKEVQNINRIESELRSNVEVEGLPTNQALEDMGIKLDVKIGIANTDDYVIAKFQKSNTNDDLIEFYEHIAFNNEIKETFKNLGTKSFEVEKILESVVEKYIDEISNQCEYSIDLIDTKNNKEFANLSPGTRAELLLKLILNYEIKNDAVKLIMLDQPDDDLDNKTIRDVLVNTIKMIKLEKQLLIVSHSANVVVNGDADNIILASVDEEQDDLVFNYNYGSLTSSNIRKESIELLDGGKELMLERFNKYNFRMEE